VRDYETVLILDPDLESAAVDRILDSVHALIVNSGGVITRSQRWGKRKFAYPIGKKTEGLYILLNFQAKPEFISEFNRTLRLNETILRVRTFRDEHPPEPAFKASPLPPEEMEMEELPEEEFGFKEESLEEEEPEEEKIVEEIGEEPTKELAEELEEWAEEEEPSEE